MIKIHTKKDCCGCTACESICHKSAITLQPDALGFLYPVVNPDLCVQCGLCEKVCAFKTNTIVASNKCSQLFYAARLKNQNDLLKSQSGGAFWAIAQYVIKNCGVVYGACFDNSFKVYHKRAVSLNECKAFRGSKYVQSDLRGVFKQIKTDLQNGLFVLFSGTPCQIAGLNSFVENKLKKNLLLVDIICHGVPSPKIWNDYIAYLEKKEKDTIIQSNFRDKELFGWRTAKATFCFSKNPEKKEWYYHKIYNTNTFRESCGVCPYCNLDRPGDITIGDFWNPSIPSKFKDDNKGCSCVILNSDKGKNIFEYFKEYLDYELMKKEDCIQYNLTAPTPLDPNRQAFEDMYIKDGYIKAMKTFSDFGWKKQIRLRLVYFKQTFKNLLTK